MRGFCVFGNLLEGSSTTRPPIWAAFTFPLYAGPPIDRSNGRTFNPPELSSVSFGPNYVNSIWRTFGLELENLIHTTIEKINSVSASLAKISEAADASLATNAAEKSRDLLRQLDVLSGTLETLSRRLGSNAVDREQV